MLRSVPGAKHEGEDGETRIFQFRPESWKLYEYDLAGLRTKATSFEAKYQNFQVLAVSETKPIYLLTPRGADYLDSLKIIKISNDHTDEEIADFSTKQVFIEGQITGEKENLFDRLVHNKGPSFECSFEFAVNESGDIALASILPSGKIHGVFMIKDVGTLAEPNFVAAEVGTVW